MKHIRVLNLWSQLKELEELALLISFLARSGNMGEENKHWQKYLNHMILIQS